MRQVCCLVVAMMAGALSMSATADEIARWEDENGVVHYGNPQFAPPRGSEPVQVMPVNSMDVPVPSAATSATGKPTVITLSRTKLQNKRGFRGFDRRPSSSQNP